MTINPIVKIVFFSKILLVHGFQHPMPSISQGTKVLKTNWSFPIVNLSIFCHHPFWVHFFLSCPHHYLLFPIDVQLCSQDHILITSMLPSFLLSACCCSPLILAIWGKEISLFWLSFYKIAQKKCDNCFQWHHSSIYHSKKIYYTLLINCNYCYRAK